MAATIKGFDGNAFDQNSVESFQGRFFRCTSRVSLSGSYATGGDTLDLSPIANAIPQSRGLVSVKIWGQGPALSLSNINAAAAYTYVAASASNPSITTGKIKAFATPGTEYSAGAYGSDALTDVIYVETVWAR